jgi:hypothetical protein
MAEQIEIKLRCSWLVGTRRAHGYLLVEKEALHLICLLDDSETAGAAGTAAAGQFGTSSRSTASHRFDWNPLLPQLPSAAQSPSAPLSPRCSPNATHRLPAVPGRDLRLRAFLRVDPLQPEPDEGRRSRGRSPIPGGLQQGRPRRDHGVLLEESRCGHAPAGREVAQGWSEVREGFQGMIRTMPGAKLTLQKSENRVEGDVVVGWGEWTLTLPSGGGGPATMQGRYLDIKGVRNGKWVYLYDHASVPMPEGS